MRNYPIRFNTDGTPRDYVDLASVTRFRMVDLALVISIVKGKDAVVNFATTAALQTAYDAFRVAMEEYAAEAPTGGGGSGGVSFFRDLQDVPPIAQNPNLLLSVSPDGLGVIWVPNSGAKGDRGDPGPIGPMGPSGPTGLTGPQGLKGDTGAQGIKGDRGPSGPTGATGATGATGEQGPQGLQGLQGLKGDKGDKGDRGDTGLQGLTGPTGPAGATGTTGATGASGPAGRSAKQAYIDLGYLPSGATDQQFVDYLAAQPLVVVRGGVDENLNTLAKLAQAFQDADIAEISSRNTAISAAVAGLISPADIGTRVQAYDEGLQNLANLSSVGLVFAGTNSSFETRTVGSTQATSILDRQSADARYLGISGKAADSSLFNGQSPAYYLSWSNLTGKPSEFPVAAHFHGINDVTGLQSALDSKQPSGSYSLVGHTHGISDISGLQVSLDSKITMGDLTWNNITGKPSSNGDMTPHTHEITDVVGLETRLDNLQPIEFKLSSFLQNTADGVLVQSGTSVSSYPIGATTATSILDRYTGDTRYAELAHTHTFASLTGKPTTISGYGITDAQAKNTGLTSLAALTGSGVVTATATGVFAMRGIGVANATSVLDRQSADARYLAVSGVAADSSLLGGHTASHYLDWTNFTGVPTTFASTIPLVSGLQAALDAKLDASASPTLTWNSITGKPTTFASTIPLVSGLQAALDAKLDASATPSLTWNAITGKPTAFASSIALVSGLQAALDAKLDATAVPTMSWANITDKPLTFAPSAHSHAIEDITNLQSALDSKAASNHSHAIASVTGLQAALDGKESDWRSKTGVEFAQLLTGDRNVVIDFHSDDTNVDYSARIIRYGGVDGELRFTNVGAGAMRFFANSFNFQSRPTFGSATPWDSANFNPDLTASLGENTFYGQQRINATGDGALVLYLGTERPWSIIQRGAGSAAQLALENTTGKQFQLSSGSAGAANIVFSPTDTGAFIRINGNNVWHAGNFDPADKANASHSHTISSISGLDAALGLKASTTSPLFAAEGGSEGGQISLARPASSTALNGNVAIDIVGNTFRVFENASPHRGAYIDLTTCGSQSRIWHEGNFNPSTKADVGSGNIFNNEQYFVSTSGSQLRLKHAASASGYGIIHRNDGSNYYILITNNNDSQGSWNGLRPLTIGLSDGRVLIQGSVPWTEANFNPSNKADVGHTHTWSSISGKPSLLESTTDTWVNSANGNPRFYFSTNSTTFIRGHGTGDTVTIRNGGDSTIAQFKNNGELYVAGSFSASEIYTRNWFRVNSSGNGIYWEAHGGGWYMVDNTWVRTYGSKNIYSSGTIQGGNIIGESDVKLKKDIISFDGALELVNRIKPRRFRWRADDRADLGVVAQELETVLPELVYDGADDKKSVNYSALGVVAIAAVQELEAKVQTQERRLEALEEFIRSMS